MLRLLKKFYSSAEFDLAVIGGGPGGYVTAIKGAQSGLKTVCIEKSGKLGGTCLNIGCIPAKALLNSSHKYYEASKHFKEFGIFYDSLKCDFEQMMRNKEDSVNGLTKGIEHLFKKNGVTHMKGHASFRDFKTLMVDNQKEIRAEYVVIATGSEPNPLPGGILDIDEKRVLSNAGALSLAHVPRSLTVIGAGVIGLEIASIYSRLGTDVTIVENSQRIAPGLDNEVANTLHKILVKQGIKFIFSAKVASGSVGSDSVNLSLESVLQGNEVPKSIESEYVLVAIGRRPFTQGLHLDYIDVTRDKSGRVNVNDKLQTLKHAHIYAIGDCVRGPMLAHKAEEEGIFVVEHMIRHQGSIKYDAIPSVIYTMPEVAQVGKTEEQLKEAKIPYAKGTFPFMANSRARCNHETEGFVKILTHKETNVMLGVHIIGPLAGEIIMEPTLGIEYGASAEDLARTCHAHPGFGEAIKEACLATFSKTINF